MTKTNKILLSVLSVLAVAALVKTYRARQEPTLLFATAPEVATPIAVEPGAKDAATPPETSPAKPNETAARKADFSTRLKSLKVADVDTARSEVAKNPHVTPPSVIASAIQLAGLYEKISDEEDARQFLDKMRDCSKDDADSPVSVKASCLGFSRRVASRFPNLSSEVEAIRARSSPDAVRIESTTSSSR